MINKRKMTGRISGIKKEDQKINSGMIVVLKEKEE